jgi:hypothetical protein
MPTTVINAITTPESTARPVVHEDLAALARQLSVHDTIICLNDADRTAKLAALGVTPSPGWMSYLISPGRLDVYRTTTGWTELVQAPGFTTYIPTVTGGGSATFTTQTGYYTYQQPKLVWVNIYLVVAVAGSGSSSVQVDLPTAPDRSTRQQLLINFEGAYSAVGAAVLFTGGAGATIDRLRLQNNGASDVVANLTGAGLTAGALLNLSGSYREA